MGVDLKAEVIWWQLFVDGLGVAKESASKSQCIDDEASDTQLQNRAKDASNNEATGATQIQPADDASPAVAPRPAWTPVGSVLVAQPRVRCMSPQARSSVGRVPLYPVHTGVRTTALV